MGGCPSVGCPPPRGLAAPYHPACPTPGTVWTVRPLPVWGRPQGTRAHMLPAHVHTLLVSGRPRAALGNPSLPLRRERRALRSHPWLV